MRLLHTSDWHLGRSLYGRRRHEEFAAFLDWLLATLAAQRIDALLVAGDVFDTGTPGTRAQELYYRFLARVAASGCRHVVIIAGNHDSPTFLDAPRGLLHDAPIHEEDLALPAAPEGEDIVHDYAALGLTLRRHPLALLRERLARRGVRSSAQLDRLPHGRKVIACGLVIGRQQPATAKGTIFVTLEDETGPVNVIVWESLRFDEAQRNALLRSQLLAVHGEWQRDQGSGEAPMPPGFAASPAALPPAGVLAAWGRPGSGQVRHLIAHRLHDLTHLLGRLAGLTTSRDFH